MKPLARVQSFMPVQAGFLRKCIWTAATHVYPLTRVHSFMRDQVAFIIEALLTDAAHVKFRQSAMFYDTRGCVSH